MTATTGNEYNSSTLYDLTNMKDATFSEINNDKCNFRWQLETVMNIFHRTYIDNVINIEN